MNADGWDVDDELDLDDADDGYAYEPAPPTPTFEGQVAQVAEYGVMVAVLERYPHIVVSRFTCPACARTVEVRAPKADWQLTRTLSRIVSAHPGSLPITAAVIVPVDAARLPVVDADDVGPVGRPVAPAGLTELVHQINAQASTLADAPRKRS